MHTSDRCLFCGTTDGLTRVGISICGGGWDYGFCAECLLGMTAAEFWRAIAEYVETQAGPELNAYLRQLEAASFTRNRITPPSCRKRRQRGSQNAAVAERSKLTASLCYAVLRQDGFRCVLCGRTAEDIVLHIDHIHPISRGGKTKLNNLRTLCCDCNIGKGNRIEQE